MEFIGAELVLFVGGRHSLCRVIRRKTMFRVSALVLAVAIAAAGTATSASAQTGGSSTSVAAPSHKAKAPRPNDRPLYNMVPGTAWSRSGDDPTSTGGGSIGYNQMLYNW
jgi:hypothetical protein